MEPARFFPTQCEGVSGSTYRNAATNTVGLNDGQKESFQDHIQNIDTAAEEARSISHQMMPRH